MNKAENLSVRMHHVVLQRVIDDRCSATPNQLLLKIRRVRRLHQFFEHLLDIASLDDSLVERSRQQM